MVAYDTCTHDHEYQYYEYCSANFLLNGTIIIITYNLHVKKNLALLRVLVQMMENVKSSTYAIFNVQLL